LIFGGLAAKARLLATRWASHNAAAEWANAGKRAKFDISTIENEKPGFRRLRDKTAKAAKTRGTPPDAKPRAANTPRHTQPLQHSPGARWQQD
jgi:hypothetical protein